MRLIELSLQIVDLEATRQFYCGVLGLRELEPHWVGRLMVQVGSSRMIFQPVHDGRHPRYHFAFDVPPDRFDAAVAWIHERGGTLKNAEGSSRFHHDGWNADSVYFNDPQGNILELIARHDRKPVETAGLTAGDDERRHLAARPFSWSELVGISEIGIGADSVADTVAVLQTRVPGLPVYDGQGSDQFTAVGDTEGLLIVARRGRIWYPNTGVPADHQPFEVLLEMKPGLHYRLTAPPYPVSVRPER